MNLQGSETVRKAGNLNGTVCARVCVCVGGYDTA